MSIQLKRLWPVLVLTAVSVQAADLIVRSGGQLICRTNLNVSSGKIMLEDGASMVISNAAVTCRDFQLDSMAALSAPTGTLNVSGFWINESAFVKPAELAMVTTVSSITETNLATGFGDTDGDGITDHGEGSFDANTNSVADFIDLNRAEPMSHIPVEWLAKEGLRTDHSEDDLDSDNDGASNWQEYHAMTDPFNSNSVLAITEFIQNWPSTGEVTVTWSSVDNRTYELQYSTNLTDAGVGFATAAADLQGLVGTTSVFVAESPDQQGFYRIRVNP